MTTTTKVRWRDRLRVHPSAEVYPSPSPEERKELRASIKKQGLLNKVIILTDQDGEHWVLDGRSRLDELEALGQLDEAIWNSKGLSPANVSEWFALADPASVIIAANNTRRHLTKSAKARCALQARLAQKEWLKQLGPNGEVPKRLGVDSKARTATKDANGKFTGSTGSSKGLVGKVAEETGLAVAMVSDQLQGLRDPEVAAAVDSGELTPGAVHGALVKKRAVLPVGNVAKKPAKKVAQLPTGDAHAKVALQEIRAIKQEAMSEKGWKLLDQLQEVLATLYDAKEANTR
jgi:hypothetical protein